MKRYPTTSFLRSQSGSALIAVYWAIAIISIAVFTTLQFLLFEVSHTNSRGNAFRAEQMAHTAAAIASNPAIESYDPLLISDTDQGSYSAVILSEGSKLPINEFLTELQRHVLENLFELWEMDPEVAQDFVDELIDWVDADSRPTGSGKERSFYLSNGKPNLPYNRLFQNLEEITLLEGYAILAQANPSWRDAFTLRSSGRLDLNSAEADLIAAVCGCSLTTAEHFVETRNGSDGIPQTEDDLTLESVEEGLDLLLTFGPEREILLPLFSIDDPIKRIVAVGTVGDTSIEQVWVIANRSTQPQILDFSTRQLYDE